MTNHIEYLLLGDGPTDEVLLSIIEWLLRDIDPSITSRGNFIDPRHLGKAPVGKNVLAWRIEQSVKLVPRIDLVFVHRDAEKSPPSQRETEIAQAVKDSKLTSHHIPVIPIKMTEAWLLISEEAIRKASGNPNGRMSLTLPSLKDIENLPNPKNTIRQLLETASGLKGRRLKAFHPNTYRVAELILDYSPLRSLSAFRKLEKDIKSSI